MMKYVSMAALALATTFAVAQEEREIEIFVVTDESSVETESKQIRMDLEINGERVELEFDGNDLNDPEAMDAIIAELPESLQDVVRGEIVILSEPRENAQIVIEREIELNGSDHEMVWIEAGGEGSMNHSDVIVELIEASDLTTDDINKIMTALEAKLN